MEVLQDNGDSIHFDGYVAACLLVVTKNAGVNSSRCSVLCLLLALFIKCWEHAQKSFMRDITDFSVPTLHCSQKKEQTLLPLVPIGPTQHLHTKQKQHEE